MTSATTSATGTIHLRDALRLMDQKTPEGLPIPFSYEGYTYNRKTKRGGELVRIPQCVHLTEEAQPNPRSMRRRQEARTAKAQDSTQRHRPGAHFRKATRNLLLPTGDKHKVIVWLMTHFNGQRVIL